MFSLSLFLLIHHNTHSINDIALLPDFARKPLRLLTFFPFNGAIQRRSAHCRHSNDTDSSLLPSLRILKCLFNFDRPLLFHSRFFLVFLVYISYFNHSLSRALFLLSLSPASLPLFLALALTFFLFSFSFLCSLLFQEDCHLFAAI